MVNRFPCKNDNSYLFSGKELSPLGLGFCAEAESLGKEMIGRDGKKWVIRFSKGSKTWTKVKTEEPLKSEEPLIRTLKTYEEDEQKLIENITNITLETSKNNKKGGNNNKNIQHNNKDENINEEDKKNTKSNSKKGRPSKKEPKEKKPRVRTAYNEFISKTLKELREKHKDEGIKTTDFMKMAVAEWKLHKEKITK